ncbi:MAG: radical SAM protein [Candidatus Howiella sp.]|jgi:putative pyruvate formate lyase activating enzyme
MRLEKCTLCPRACGALRDEESGAGACKMPALPVLARAGLHFYEEPCISGSRGSGAVFFSGCALGCVFCQNHAISAGRFGRRVTVARLAEIFRELKAAGAHNINLVNPTHFAPAIRAALDLYHPSIPIVYNTGGYERVETLRLLEGYIDIYLPDLKYTDSARAARYSGAVDYFQYAAPALREMARQTAGEVEEGGLLKRGMVVRHLLLPQGTADAIAVARFVREALPAARFSLMRQYLPLGRAADFPEINRRVTDREYAKVLGVVEELGFPSEVYVQEKESAKREFIPAFDLTGVEKPSV